MVELAQLVRAPGCGPGGRGFESLISPHNLKHTLRSVFFVFSHRFYSLFQRYFDAFSDKLCTDDFKIVTR